jgi:hypothetical protein
MRLVRSRRRRLRWFAYELIRTCTPSVSFAEGAGDIATVNAVAALVGIATAEQIVEIGVA